MLGLRGTHRLNFRRPLLLMVLAALLPLVVLSAALGVSAMGQRQAALEIEAQARVDQTSALVDRELQGQAAVLQAISQLPSMDGPIQADWMHRIIKRVGVNQPQWRTVVITDLEGNRLVAEPDLAPGRAKLTDLSTLTEVVQTGRPVFAVATGPLLQESYAIRVPVIRDGQTRHVIAAAMKPNAITKVLSANPLPPDWIGEVLDPKGRIVARTQGGSALIGKIDEAARRAVGDAEQGLYSGPSLEGRQMVTAYRRVPASGWSVHISIPRNVYNAPLRRALWLLIIGGVVSLLMAGLFLWLMARELRLRRREEAVVEDVRRMEALGRMTGGVAHDFNNLLMVVQGSAELLKRRKADPDKLVLYADAILSAAQRGQGLTRQLLAFARRSAHEPSAFDVQSRVATLHELLSRSTRGDIEVAIAVAPDAWPVFADPDALEIALINLAVNARDAMPDGGRLTVTCRNVTLAKSRGDLGLEGDFLAITVQDTGSGIDPAHLPHIFEPFYTTKPAGKGTGLGLSQVYGFARQAGGAVSVASPPGEGAAFTVYLPRALQAASPTPASSTGPENLAAEQGRMLLVEDNDDVANVAGAMLSDAGYVVTRVSGGDAALALLDDGAVFDAMLSDIVMEGGMSGLELAPQVAARRPEMPILLMTGYSEDLARGVGGGWPILAKPFQQSQLVAALNAARSRDKRQTA